MEKISRILPSSPRVASADLRNSGVARPGSPSFGRPVGVSALAAVSKFDGAGRAAAELGELRAEREPTKSKDPHVEIVERMSRDFFVSRPTVEAPRNENGVDLAEEIVAKFHDGDSDLDPFTGSGAHVAEELGEEVPVVGGQLDVMA
jgi:hypothetical protein